MMLDSTSTMRDSGCSEQGRGSEIESVQETPTGGQASRPRIVAILPRGEALRNFVYSGSLELLTPHADLTVLAVWPDDQIEQLLHDRFEDVRSLREYDDPWLTRICREWLDLAHNRYLWSEAARERWRLRDQEAVTPLRKLKRLVKKAVAIPFGNQRGVEALAALERRVSLVFSRDDEFGALFEELQPDLVFNGSHVHGKIAIRPVQAAQARGVPTAAFLFSWDNLTSQGRIIPPYDHYFVWNSAIADQLRSIYPQVRPEQVEVTGTPQFDFHFRRENLWSREAYCHEVGADPGRPIVLYSTGMANHMPGEPELIQILADTLNGLKELGSPQLVVRVYPKDQTGRFETLKQQRPDILFPRIPWESRWQTPLPEDTPLLSNMLAHCALGVNVASTVSLELCMFGKPVINLGFNPPGVPESELCYARYYHFDHYKPIVESGAVRVAHTVDELRDLTVRALTQPEADQTSRTALLDQMFGPTLDGLGGRRIAAKLLALARQHAAIHEQSRAGSLAHA